MPLTDLHHVQVACPAGSEDDLRAFYGGVLGFELMQRYGTQAAFLAAGGYHHHIGLNTWESLGGSPPPPGRTGLYHTAILYPTRPTLADALRRLMAAGILAISDPALAQRLDAWRQALSDSIPEAPQDE